MRLKTVMLSALILFFAECASGQGSEKFDIVSYSVPSDWVRETGESYVAYTISNNATGEFARIILFKSLPGTGNINTDFDIEWKELVQANYNPGDITDSGVSEYKDGWVAKLGVAPFVFNDRKHAVILNTLVKDRIKMSNVFITNTVSYQSYYEDFGSSLSFNMETADSDYPEVSSGLTDQRLIGKWNRTGASHPHYADAASWGTAGYTTGRYEFKPDGTYIYTERSFWMMHSNIILVKESGRYTSDNNLLTVIPEKSVIESYTKKNGVDELGTLVKSEMREPEQTTYTYTFHYFPGIQEWNLVLQAPYTTKRDGSFSSNDTYKNAWYFNQNYTDNDLTSATGN